MLKLFATFWDTVKVHLWADPRDCWSYTGSGAIVTNTTTALREAVAGKSHFLVSLQVHNSSATATNFSIASAATSKALSRAPASMVLAQTMKFEPPLEMAEGEACNFITVTTGASVLVTAQGFTISKTAS